MTENKIIIIMIGGETEPTDQMSVELHNFQISKLINMIL